MVVQAAAKMLGRTGCAWHRCDDVTAQVLANMARDEQDANPQRNLGTSLSSLRIAIMFI